MRTIKTFIILALFCAPLLAQTAPVSSNSSGTSTPGVGLSAVGKTLNGEVPNTVGDPGATLCDRFNNKAVANPGRLVSGQNESNASVFPCGIVNLDSGSTFAGSGATYSTFQVGPLTVSTDIGWNLGDRQQLTCDNSGTGAVTGGGNGCTFMGSSVFPTGVAGGAGFTLTGSNTASTSFVTTTLAGTGADTLSVPPGSEFIINGDTTKYVLTPCGHNNASCGSSQSTSQASNFYTVVPGTQVTFKITPNLSGSVTANGTTATLLSPIFTFGDANTQKNGSGSVQQQRLSGPWIAGNSGVGICALLGTEPQENSRIDNTRCAQSVVGYVFYGNIHSGTHENVTYTPSDAICSAFSGYLVGFEIGVSQTTINNPSAVAGTTNCTPAAFPFGLYHITNNPLSVIGNGTVTLNNPHGELNGSSSTGAEIYIDSTTGNTIINGGQGCSASTCKDFVYYASAARSSLDIENPVCSNGTTTVNIVDDVRDSNVIPFGGSCVGTGYYRISGNGTVETNLVTACGSGFNNGWFVSGSTRAHCTGGVQDSVPLSALPTQASGTFLSNASTSAAVPAANALTVMNPQTATYQVVAADFSAYKTIPVASGSFTITLVASGSQPPAGQFINIINYGAGTVTVARSGQNINGAAGNLTLSAATAASPTQVTISSDGTNYFAAVSSLNATTFLGKTWNVPGTLGATTPNTGAFTTLSINNLLFSNTAPTITGAGCGGSAASIASNNGTASFTINVGTAPTSGGCTVTLPTATNGWACDVTDLTTNSTSVFLQKETSSSTTTSVVLVNYSDVAVATAPVANDIWSVRCAAR